MASVVWDYFSKDESKTLASCKKEACKKNIPIKTGNTTGLIHHLKSKHPEDFKLFEKEKEKREKEKAEKRKRNDESDPLTRKQMKQPKFSFTSQSEAEKITQAKFEDSLEKYVANSGVSFQQAAALTSVMHSVNKKIKVPSSKVLSRRMEEKADSTLKQVHNIMAAVRSNILSVGFTTDLWTSRAGDAYMSLTCSFIDEMWRLHRYTPYVRYFPGSHTGKNIALELDAMIEELEFDSPSIIKYSVNDNASNQKKAIRESFYLTEYNCDLHTLQLGIGDTFKGVKNVLGKCKQIAKFAKQSPQSMEQLQYGASEDEDLEDDNVTEVSNVEVSPSFKLLRQARLKKEKQGGSTSRLRSEMERYESYSYAHRHCNILY